MQTITLQTKNVSLEVKEKAERIAISQGYSSIQDVIRHFLNDFAHERITLARTWGAGLDPEVQKAIQEYREGKYTTILPHEDVSEKLNELFDTID